MDRAGCLADTDHCELGACEIERACEEIKGGRIMSFFDRFKSKHGGSKTEIDLNEVRDFGTWLIDTGDVIGSIEVDEQACQIR